MESEIKTNFHRIHKLCVLGLLLALSLILSYVESLIPVFFYLPGAKLGLANLVIVLTLYRYGAKEAILLNVLRVFLVAFLFTNGFSLLYSISGALFSFGIMVLAKKFFRLHVITVSSLGGVFHNLGQILVAGIAMQTVTVLTFLPFLILVGAITGVVLGILANMMLRYMR